SRRRLTSRVRKAANTRAAPCCLTGFGRSEQSRNPLNQRADVGRLQRDQRRARREHRAMVAISPTPQSKVEGHLTTLRLKSPRRRTPSCAVSREEVLSLHEKACATWDRPSSSHGN